MRAVWYDRQGPANEVIVTGELPTPEPGTGQVRVRLEASGVNPSDTYRRRGAVPAEYPQVIPNSDGAGVNPAGRGTVTFPLPAWFGLRQTLALLGVAGVGSMVKVTLTEQRIGTMFSVKWV